MMVQKQTSKKLNNTENILDRKMIKIKSTSNKTKKIVKRGRRAGKKARISKGVVYLSHIPHGFYEEQIEAYFNQFGEVTNISLPRSRTGRARGYAFIEFKHCEVAAIAAETMNNYIMFSRLLKAKFIPPRDQKPRLFVAAKAARENHNTAADKAALAVQHNRKLKNRHLKTSLEAGSAVKLLRRKRALQKRLLSLGGVDFDFVVNETSVQSVFLRSQEKN